MVENILIICTANICRSPLAQVILADLLPNKQVLSAGVLVEDLALNKQGAANYCVSLAKRNGFDLSQHQAKPISKELIENADLILVMNHEQLEVVSKLASGARAKTLLFGQWIGQGDILDPYGQDMLSFERCYKTLKKAAHSWQRRLA